MFMYYIQNKFLMVRLHMKIRCKKIIKRLKEIKIGEYVSLR